MIAPQVCKKTFQPTQIVSQMENYFNLFSLFFVLIVCVTALFIIFSLYSDFRYSFVLNAQYIIYYIKQLLNITQISKLIIVLYEGYVKNVIYLQQYRIIEYRCKLTLNCSTAHVHSPKTTIYNNNKKTVEFSILY